MGWIVYYWKKKDGKRVGARKEKRYKTRRGAEGFIRKHQASRTISLGGTRVY